VPPILPTDHSPPAALGTAICETGEEIAEIGRVIGE
jgi:hypothetical protein